MLHSLLPLLLLVLGATAEDDPWGIYKSVCLVGQTPLYDPTQQASVPWYTIDLDLPPRQRWEVVAASYGQKIQFALDTVRGRMDAFGGDGTFEMLVILMDDAVDRLNEPYRSEIKAIASMANLDVRELTILNMFYEVAKACTSLVAQAHDGKMYHGRNLDFGFMYGWNKDSHTWDLTEALKAITINLNFVRGGSSLFKGVSFAGHLGIITGMRPGQYSISTNTRFGGDSSAFLDFFIYGLGSEELAIYANRDMLTNCATYEDALNYIENVPLMASAYFILSGAKLGQGVVVTRAANGTDHVEKVDVTQPGKWYVLETNYDWDKPVLFLDDRRKPGNDCMKKLGQSGVGLSGIYQVLSSQQNLNKATVYTTLMQVNDGIMETITRSCPDPCYFV